MCVFCFGYFKFLFHYSVPLAPPLRGFGPSCIKVSFTSVCNNTFFFYFRFLKSYLRNFGVAPDSAALMVIERGIETELKCGFTYIYFPWEKNFQSCRSKGFYKICVCRSRPSL